MKGNRAWVRIILVVGAMLSGALATATPPPEPPGHRPDTAHCILSALVADFNKRDGSVLDRVRVVTDHAGVVEEGESDRFYAGLFGAGGGALELIDWGLLRQERTRAVYMITLGNDKYVGGRTVATNEPVYVYRHSTRWFVSFYSDRIVSMRDTGDLELLAEEAVKTPTCASITGL